MRIPETTADASWPSCGAGRERFADSLRDAGLDPDTNTPDQNTPTQNTPDRSTAPGTPNIPSSKPIAGLQPPDGQTPERRQDMGLPPADPGDVEGSDNNQDKLEERFIKLYEHLMDKQVSFKETVEPFKTDNQIAAKG